MKTKNEIIETIISLDTSLGACFYYKLQCTHPRQDGWYDWMPDNTLKKFTFEEDAIKEIEYLTPKGIPFYGVRWRVVFVATTSEVVSTHHQRTLDVTPPPH